MNMDVAQEMVEPASRILRILSNPHRLLVLCTLRDGEKYAGELGRDLDLSQSALSQHLAVLREEGLVETRREGQRISYRLASPEVRRIIQLLHDLYCAVPALPDGPPAPAKKTHRKEETPS
jgi:DNA-binding transcriptional ArsR family regulator